MLSKIAFMQPCDDNQHKNLTGDDYDFYLLLASKVLDKSMEMYTHLLMEYFYRSPAVFTTSIGEEEEELIKRGFLRPKRYGYKFFPGGKYTHGFYADIENEVEGY